MKKTLALAIAALALAVPATAGAQHQTMAMKYKVSLSGKNEVGAPGDPMGSGKVTLTLNSARGTVCYSFMVKGIKLPAAAAHIHAGHAGKNGPVVVPFPSAPAKNGRAAGCAHAKASIIKAIENHPASYYVNVHTTDYSAGALRGQV